MSIVGGLDIHRKQLTFDYLDTVTGQVTRGQVTPADREHLRAWLARLAGRGGVAFAFEGSWAPGSRQTPSCQSCVMAAGACCSPAAASRCTLQGIRIPVRR